MIHFDGRKREISVSVEAETLPGLVKDMWVALSVDALAPGKARATAQISAVARQCHRVLGAFLGPMMRRRPTAVSFQGSEDLRIYAESGQLSAAKVKALVRARAKPFRSAHVVISMAGRLIGAIVKLAVTVVLLSMLADRSIGTNRPRSGPRASRWPGRGPVGFRG